MQFSVADEEDLSYYKDQPDRLIDEFKKMKATKKKAEQFAIEAKQSAQKVNLCSHPQPFVTSLSVSALCIYTHPLSHVSVCTTHT